MKLGHAHHSELDRTLTPHWHPDCSLELAPDRNGHVLHISPGGMIRLDDDRTRISELIDGLRSVQQIIDTLHSRFPNLPEMGTDVDEFIKHAHDMQWIVLN